MVIATLQDHAYDAISMAGDHEELLPQFTTLRTGPPPMLINNYEMDSECLTGELLHAAAVQSEVCPANDSNRRTSYAEQVLEVRADCCSSVRQSDMLC